MVIRPHADLVSSLLDNIPARPGIYRVVPTSGESHISWTVSLRRRSERLLKTFGNAVANPIERLECWPTASKLDSSLLLYAITRDVFPQDYSRRLRLRAPWFLSLSHLDNFPQLAVSNRIHEESPCVLGPFGSRDQAQAFAEQVLSLYQLRRCPGVLSPSPDHPGCIYGEMNQCLRPCQCAVSPEEYASEAARVVEFLGAAPAKVTGALSLARQQASENLDFEQAAQIHKRLERIKGALALRDEAITDARSFRGIAVVRAYQDRCCYLRPMWDGFWQAPIVISFQEGDERRSLDAELRERLQGVLGTAAKNRERVDHLALFQRWYGSSWREGEWFPFTTLATVDYSRLVRRISKLVATAPAPV